MNVLSFCAPWLGWFAPPRDRLCEPTARDASVPRTAVERESTASATHTLQQSTLPWCFDAQLW